MISVIHQPNGIQPNPTNRHDKNRILLLAVAAMAHRLRLINSRLIWNGSLTRPIPARMRKNVFPLPKLSRGIRIQIPTIISANLGIHHRDLSRNNLARKPFWSRKFFNSIRTSSQLSASTGRKIINEKNEVNGSNHFVNPILASTLAPAAPGPPAAALAEAEASTAAMTAGTSDWAGRNWASEPSSFASSRSRV